MTQTVAPAFDDGVAPLIAIVGRPNVGKSRLFNRMTGTQFAIVEDMPGVTRDRQYGEGRWGRARYQVVDTGGFEPESHDDLLRQMREQARLAIDEADVVVFLVDAQSGLVPADIEIAHMLRETRKPVFTVVNKVDGDRHESNVPEFYALGLDPILPLSAEHGRNYAEFMDAVTEGFPEPDEDPAVDDLQARVAVIGKPNAGKSSLINRLLGEERLLTSDVPGTTRDAINTHVTFEGRRYLFIDTAGVRRKRSIAMTVEKYSVVQAFKAVDRADVVLYVLDATEPISSQDQRLAGLVEEKGRGVIILLNKWDLVEKDHRTADQFVDAVRDEFRFHPNAPVITISALTGQRAHRILPAVDAVFEQFTRRIGTGELNRWADEALRRAPPRTTTGQRLKVFYVSQVATRPPTFMFVVNHPEAIHFSYQRYLVNSLREAYGFDGVPLKVFFRARGKREDDGKENA